MHTIDLETHFYTHALFDYLKTRQDYPKLEKKAQPGDFNLYFAENIALYQSQAFIDTLCDIGVKRIAQMDQAGLAVQVLSFSSPGIDEFYPDKASASSFATELNDTLADAIKQHPTRFKGFACISPYDSAKGVKELERTIKELNFVGWLAHANFGENKYFDQKCYWPLLEAAEALNIPIYLHPTVPLTTNFSDYGFSLAGPPLGFQVEVALCLMRMIYAGVFDQFPKLTIILGHMGETLPFLMNERLDWPWVNKGVAQCQGFIDQRPDIKRPPSQIMHENIYVTTSGRFSKPLLDYVLAVMGEDRLMLATDYPYEDLQQSMDFIRNAGLSNGVLEKICYKNAQKLGF